MKFTTIFSLVIGIFVSVSVFAQQYTHEEAKEFDIDYLKNRSIYLPEFDKVPNALKNEKAFKDLKTDAQIEEAWSKLLTDAIKASTYDMTEYKVMQYNFDKLKKEKDKNAIVLSFEKNIYGNWCAYLYVVEPKTAIIASALANDLDLSKSEDIILLFNMLHYSMIKAGKYYGDDIKPLYRGFENEYKVAMDNFSDNIKKRVLLVEKYTSKDAKKYNKYNDKIKAYMTAEWKMSAFEILKKDEIAEKLKNEKFNGYYLREFVVNTENPMVKLKYYVVLHAVNNAVIFDFNGQNLLKSNNYKFMQEQIDEWLYYFMDAKKRREYDKQKAMLSAPAETNTKSKTTPAKEPKTNNTKSKVTNEKKK